MSELKQKCLVSRNVEKGITTMIIGSKHYREKDPNGEIYAAAQSFRAKRSRAALDFLMGLLAPELKAMEKAIEVAFSSDEFEVIDDQICLKGTNIPLPPVMVRKVKHFAEKGYPLSALANFWSLCLLNPSAVARDRFYEYCDKYNVTITDGGYAVLYKTVTHKRKAKYRTDLADFVAEAVLKVKRSKKAKKWYDVYLIQENGEDYYELHHTQAKNLPTGEGKTKSGNLDYLFGKLDEIARESKTLYTDKHSKKMNIYLGTPVSMSREKCDPNINSACSYGLHVGSEAYVQEFASPSDTVLATLVSPMNVVALPFYDNSKIRVCEYFPYAIMSRDSTGHWDELETEYFEENFRDYEKDSIKLLTLNTGQVSVEVSPRVIDLYGTGKKKRKPRSKK